MQLQIIVYLKSNNTVYQWYVSALNLLLNVSNRLGLGLFQSVVQFVFKGLRTLWSTDVEDIERR